MTSCERILTALSLKVPDRVPSGLWGFNREAHKIFKAKTGSDDPEEYFKMDCRGVVVNETKVDVNQYRKFHKVELHPTASLNEWGTAFVPGSNPAFDHFIPPFVWAESVKDIEKYPLPDLLEDYRYDGLKEKIENIQKRGLATVGLMAMTIFEVAWQIRGFNELFNDFVFNPKMAECLLDGITELRCYQAKRFVELGVDILHIGDDVGMQDRLMMSPETYRKWLKERLAKVIASAKKVNPDIPVFYHSCGYVEPIIPDFIDIGITCLNPVQPECMDPEKLKKEYGTHLAFWGTIGTQTTMPFGTPEDVRREVKRRIEVVGAGGGLVIAPTHALEPEVPWENVMALIEAVEKYGIYK